MSVDIHKIRSLREKRGMSLADAAKAAGFTNRQMWHQIEAGNRTNLTIATLDKIAAALKVDAKDLLK